MDNYKYLTQDSVEMLENNIRESSQEVYLAVKKSYNICLKCLWIEEKFNILIENYKEFEKEIYALYNILITSNTDSKIKIEQGQKGIITLNRRLANLLGSVRMYIDQVKHDLSTISKETGNEGLKDEFSKETNIQYDSNLGYQMMEFLRNQMQHEALAIESLYIVIPYSKNIMSVTPIFLEIDYRKVKKIRQFEQKIKAKKIIEDLEVNEINIIPMIRDYLTGLKKVHDRYRIITQSIVEENVSVVYSKVNLNYDTPNFNKVGFVKVEKDNKYIESVLVQESYILDIIEKRKPSILVNEKQHFVGMKSYYNPNMITISNCENIRIKYNSN